MLKQILCALDVGERYIGVAVTDPDRLVVFPKDVWEWKGNENVLRNFLDILLRDYTPEFFVVGVQEFSESSAGAVSSRKQVEEILKEKRFEVKYVDEYVSTIEAKNRVADIEDFKKDRYDDIAAQIILERYLKNNE